MRRSIVMSAVVVAWVLALAGCRDDGSAPESAAGAASNPPQKVEPSATAPADETITTSAPATDGISFAGYGAARFGADETAVRAAWGEALQGAPEAAGDCYELAPVPLGLAQSPVSFMFEGGKFVRVDVQNEALIAPGGGKLGSSADEILRLYPGAETSPHKYVEGARMLRAEDPAGGPSAVVFETDAQGKVVAWRVGLDPQVGYVEGCS